MRRINGRRGSGRTHVVGIGGGTGLSVLLAGLRRHAEQGVDISAIVSVADDGGSTGKLRQHLDIPAVGDLRNCIVALSAGQPLWGELFQHRFIGGNGLSGHALGNLIMAALVQRAGGLGAAVEQLARPLKLRGRVLPATEERVTLCARLEDGEVVAGESRIPARGLAGAGRRIARVELEPSSPAPAPGVLEAIASADAVVLGPGSLYTSVVPNLLVDGVAEAIRDSGALTLYVCNLTTQSGETDGFDAADHLRVLEEYLGHGAIDVCLMNGAAAEPEAAGERCGTAAGPEPVRWDRRAIAATGALPLIDDLLSRGGVPNRHDPERLARTVVSLARSLRREPRPRYSAALPYAALPPRSSTIDLRATIEMRAKC